MNVKSLAVTFLRALLTVVLPLGILAGTPRLVCAEVDEAQELGKFLGQHGYGTMRVDTDDRNREVVEASVNGKILDFVVDTGCGRTCVTASCARHLGLSVHPMNETSWGAGGPLKDKAGQAIVASFKLNNYEINRTNTIVVLPGSADTNGIRDGLFGFDYLHLNAAILPVGARIFLYKPGNGPVVSIAPYMTALGYQSVSLVDVRGGLRVEGTVGGQPLVALIDCGAAYSTFDLAYVKKMKSPNVSYDILNLEGLDGQQNRANAFTCDRMQLGSLPIKPFTMTVTETPIFAHDGFNALLGYDFLAAHNAIIDLGNNQLWLK